MALPPPLTWSEAVIFACSETLSLDLFSLSAFLTVGEHSYQGPSSPAAFLLPQLLFLSLGGCSFLSGPHCLSGTQQGSPLGPTTGTTPWG